MVAFVCADGAAHTVFSSLVVYGDVVTAGGSSALGACPNATECGTLCWHVWGAASAEPFVELRFDDAALRAARGSPAVVRVDAESLTGVVVFRVHEYTSRGSVSDVTARTLNGGRPLATPATPATVEVAAGQGTRAVLWPDENARATPRVTRTAALGDATLDVGGGGGGGGGNDTAGSGVVRMYARCTPSTDGVCVVRLRRPTTLGPWWQTTPLDDEPCETRGHAPAVLYAFAVAAATATAATTAGNSSTQVTPASDAGVCTNTTAQGTVYGSDAITVDGDASEWPGFDECTALGTPGCSLWYEDANEPAISDHGDLHRMWVLVSDSALCVRVNTYDRLLSPLGAAAPDLALPASTLLHFCVQTTGTGPPVSVCDGQLTDFIVRIDNIGDPFTSTVQDCGAPFPNGCSVFSTPVASASIVPNDTRHFELCVALEVFKLTAAAAAEVFDDRFGVFTLMDRGTAEPDDFMPDAVGTSIVVDTFCGAPEPATDDDDDDDDDGPTRRATSGVAPYVAPLAVVGAVVSCGVVGCCCCVFAGVCDRRRCRDERRRRRRRRRRRVDTNDT